MGYKLQTMIQASTLAFLKNIELNNNKIWFDANRIAYEAAKKDFELFIEQVLQANTALIPELAGRKAKDCIFRIFKDVRFSKDKVPYKNNFGAAFGKGDKKTMGAGYYVHLQADNHSFIGGGIWMPDALTLKAIRQEIDYCYDEFLNIVTAKEFKKIFGSLDTSQQLKKCPKEYTDDNPALAYLKLKSFTVATTMSDKTMMSKASVAQITEACAVMKPLIDFLNRAISQ